MSVGPPRTIAHVDMDAFYASVEQRDNPALRRRPVLVGGRGRRSVVAAASYEARRYGVHSAMPMMKALELCPMAEVVPPRMARYKDASQQVFEIFHRFTPEVEGLSLDEAFLDLTGSLRLYGTARSIAASIKQMIRDEVGLIGSVGIAPNKFLAKLASDYGKPDGLHEVQMAGIRGFLDPLPVRRLWGVGRKAGAKLGQAGIHTVEALRLMPRGRLTAILGASLADHLLALVNGEDDRPIVVARHDKSISHELTFEYDLTRREDLKPHLLDLCIKVAERMRRKGLRAHTVTVKIRTADFRTHTRSQTYDGALSGNQELFKAANTLLDRWWGKRRTAPIRLLGVVGTKFENDVSPDLFSHHEPPQVDVVSDAIKARFGEKSITPGALLSRNKVSEKSD